MMPREKVQIDGNEQVVDCLTKWLDRAKQGAMDSVAIACTYGTAASDVDTAGVCGREHVMGFSLDILKLRVVGDFMGRMNPPPTATATADKWTYNLLRCPCSYDFIAWLVNAEMTRVRENAPGPLKVHFYHGDRPLGDALQTQQRTQMFHNVMRPVLGLVGGVESNEAIGGRILESFSFQSAIDGYKNGERVPRFSAGEGHKVPGAVTITLRETNTTPHRNSNREQWLKFAEWLSDRGERVVFIPDTNKSEQIGRFATDREAAADLHKRMRLYEAAKCNLFVSNGPATLALFTDVPWMIFNRASDDDPAFHNTARGWKVFAGIEPGEQWPWCRPDQRIVWEDDTFEVLKREWLRFEEESAKADAA